VTIFDYCTPFCNEFSHVIKLSNTSKLTSYLVSCVLSMKVTRCSAISERPRCRVRYSFRQK